MSEQNREKEERLFRALSGVEGELLHRSEQNEGVEKRKANGKIRRFPLYYVSRIAAACLCFVVMGAVFVTVRNSSKMADSTSNDAAAPQSAYSAILQRRRQRMPQKRRRWQRLPQICRKVLWRR